MPAAKTRAARIAAAVAERYAHSQSYRAFLAAEAERAIQQAQAAAEVAAQNAQAVAAAQQRLLDAFDESARRRAEEDRAQAAAAQAEALAAAQAELVTPAELHLWPDLAPESTPRETPRKPRRMTSPQQPAKAIDPSGLTVRLYEDAASVAHVDLALPRQMPPQGHTSRGQARSGDQDDRDDPNHAEANALDEEIAFRQAPVFEEPAGPATALPANLIEFPRQLVASRKARPRYAEGPLRDESAIAPIDGQLRIFEVDPAQISTAPTVEADTSPAPQWTSIWLDGPADVTNAWPVAAQISAAEAGTLLPTAPTLQAASVPRRLLAGLVSCAIVLAAAGIFAVAALAAASGGLDWHAGGPGMVAVRFAAASIETRSGMGPAQFAIMTAVACAFLLLAYQALFLWLAGETPGMRVAGIGLCTFADGTPTRRALRRRLAAMLLSACALGMGFGWALLDEDRLTWHDRITRTYLRKY
jgi:uncharacterized RDD family membrane protein YckC